MAFAMKRMHARRRTAAAIALAVVFLGIAAGCELLRSEERVEAVARAAEPAPPAPTTAAQPGKFAFRSGCCIFQSDFELDPADPLFAELETLPEQIATELRLPLSNNIVQVYLFDTQENYEQFMFTPKVGRYRNQPPRRAYFFAEPRIGGLDDLKVYTWMGDPQTLRTDLRHELTHAILHGVLKDVPLWLDEGLASFFELPPANDGVNPQHLEMLRMGVLEPDLAALEPLKKVEQMNKPEYREAWAWVHYMLRGSPVARDVLHQHLQALRGNATPGPLLHKLRDAVPSLEQSMVDHIRRIEFPRTR
jgi:hypothetical protein